jgi:hypothetical protein
VLVTLVSLRGRRGAIAVDIAEAAAALDSPGTGNVVFATLVDDPASVGDTVDAYLGEIMLEAASAATVLDAGLAYVASIDEATTATDTQDAAAGAPLVPRAAMLPGVFVNSDGTARQANANGIMVNL